MRAFCIDQYKWQWEGLKSGLQRVSQNFSSTIFQVVFTRNSNLRSSVAKMKNYILVSGCMFCTCYDYNSVQTNQLMIIEVSRYSLTRLQELIVSHTLPIPRNRVLPQHHGYSTSALIRLTRLNIRFFAFWVVLLNSCFRPRCRKDFFY